MEDGATHRCGVECAVDDDAVEVQVRTGESRALDMGQAGRLGVEDS